MQTTSEIRTTGPVPRADHIGEALVALDELAAAGRDLRAARLLEGDALIEAEARFNRARATLRILKTEADEHEQAAS